MIKIRRTILRVRTVSQKIIQKFDNPPLGVKNHHSTFLCPFHTKGKKVGARYLSTKVPVVTPFGKLHDLKEMSRHSQACYSVSFLRCFQYPRFLEPAVNAATWAWAWAAQGCFHFACSMQDTLHHFFFMPYSVELLCNCCI